MNPLVSVNEVSSMRVAAVQMVSGPDVAANLQSAADLVAQAVAQGAELVVLPEYFPLVSAEETHKLRVAEEDAAKGGGGPIQDFLANTAQKYGIWLVGGSIPLRSGLPDKVMNSALVYSPNGNRVARYDKIHLFGYRHGTESYNESNTIAAGRHVVTFDTPAGRVGVAICYDIRFPEQFRAMGDVSLVVVPAAFTVSTGRAHWELLLRARAVENQCYVLASAQGGQHPSGRVTYGDSLLADPWGDVVCRLPQGPGVIVGDVDQGRLRDIRDKLPALSHRRL